MTDLRIAVGPSALIAVGLSATHFAAGALLWLAPLAVWAQALLTLILAANLVYLMARHALLHAPQSIVTLQTRDALVSLQARNGDWLEGDVLDSSYVSPRLTIVNFRPRGRRRARHVILVPDNVDPRDFRRLRTWLRWKRSEAVVVDPA